MDGQDMWQILKRLDDSALDELLSERFPIPPDEFCDPVLRALASGKFDGMAKEMAAPGADTTFLD